MSYSKPSADILDKFPKIRADLPPAYQAVYESHYKKNRGGETQATSLSSKMERWLHRKVAEDVQGGTSDLCTLEIGAGTLNQLAFEPGIRTYDIIEPFTALFEGSPLLKRVRHVYRDISDLTAEPTYDRITSVATFEHIMDLPFVVARAALLLKDEGSLRTSIPNEGTILWKLGTMVTGYEYKRLYGLDYQVLMRYEHVNTADEIEEVLRYFFQKASTSVYGLSRGLAFYRFIACAQPHRERAREYLAKRTSSVG
ncbi:MAG: class I SAM-dependent methyltransferase [Bacteroidota bacterium]